MKPSRVFVLVPVLAFAFACATTPNYTAPPATNEKDRITQLLVDREEKLTLAIAQGRSAAVNDLLSEDFRCAVKDHPFFTFKRVPVRAVACTGFGHEWTRDKIRPEWVEAFQGGAPRVASIDDIAVKVNENGAIVVSLQSYTHWLPYAGSEPRRSRVIDHWAIDRGEWRLTRRLSEPLAANETAALIPGR